MSQLNLRRPVDRGYVVNWDLQKEIWTHVFSKLMKIDPKKCHLIITEPPFNLPAAAAAQDEVIYKHFQFKSCLTSVPASLVMHERIGALKETANETSSDDEENNLNKVITSARCGVVVDVGFSFAHITPVFDGRIVRSAVRRVNLGGKALTNYLKELVSYRQWNMMDEYFLVDDVKEKLCYVAADEDDFETNLKNAKVKGATNEITKEYVLPDGVHVIRGYVKSGPAHDPDSDDDDSDDDPDEGSKKRKKLSKSKNTPTKKTASNNTSKDSQTLGMGNERFMVPEALFHPSDVGLKQAGIAEATKQAIESTKKNKQLFGMFYGNVVLCGGCCRFPGFKERFISELRPFVEASDLLQVSGVGGGVGNHGLGNQSETNFDDPVTCAWRGGSRIGASEEFERLALTRDEYVKDQAVTTNKLEQHAPVVNGRM